MKSKFLNYNIGRCLLVKDTRLIYTKEVEWKYPTVRKVSSFYYLCVWKRSVLFIKTNKITCKSKTIRNCTFITMFSISVLLIQVLKECLCTVKRGTYAGSRNCQLFWRWEPGELPELQTLFLFYIWIQGQSLETILASPNMKLAFGDGSGERIKSLGVHKSWSIV